MIRSQQQQMLHEQEKQMIEAQNLSIIETDNKIWCPICRRAHDKKEMGSILFDNCMESRMDESEDDNTLAPPGEEDSHSRFDINDFSMSGFLTRWGIISEMTLNYILFQCFIELKFLF